MIKFNDNTNQEFLGNFRAFRKQNEMKEGEGNYI